MLPFQIILAIRNIKKRTFYTSIKVIGLALGISCFILMALYIGREQSFDSSFSKANNIYRIIMKDQTGNRYSGTSHALAYHAKQEIPAIKEMVRISYPYRLPGITALVHRNVEKRFYEDNILLADSTFFEVFDFRFTEGNAKNALLNPDAIVISKLTAKKYFGNEPALNKTLRINDGQPLTITGVADVPDNTHLDFDFLRPYHSDPNLSNVWEYTTAFSYVVVDDQDAVPAIQKQLDQIVLNNSTNHRIDFLKNFNHTLQPFHSIHTTVLDWDIIKATSGNKLNTIGIIAAFILLLAVINFVNLATAISSTRAKEVGMNKILGAGKYQLILQYMIEALLVSFIAGMISIGVVYLAIPAFNELVETNINLLSKISLAAVAGFIGFLFLVGVIAGIYPALLLTKFKPTRVVKKSFTATPGQRLFRQGLVVFQFTITVSLIIGTFVVRRQINYMQESDLGFNKEQLLVVPIPQTSRSKYERFKTELLRNNDILKVAGVSTPMGSQTGSTIFQTPEMPGETGSNFALTISADENFLDLMEIPLVKGRNFGKTAADIGNTYIVNETTVRQFNLADPLMADFKLRGQTSGRIVGVVKDFHLESFSHKINALVINFDTVNSYKYTVIKLKAGTINQSVAYVQDIWKSLNPAYPIQYFFQDEHFNRLYKQHVQLRTLVSVFSNIALGLACMGLFGLSSFETLRRRKEIGIRKVLGASVSGVTALLSKDFLKLVAISVIIASPIAWWAMNRWLQDFAYRVNIGWVVFAIAGVITLMIALVTVSFQAIKAALSNPVESLRTE